MATVLASVTPEGQITIPEGLRQEVGLEPDDRVSIETSDGALVIRRVPPPPDSSHFWVPQREEWLPWSEIQRLVQEERALEFKAKMDRGDGD